MADTPRIQGADVVLAKFKYVEDEAPKIIAASNKVGGKILLTAAKADAPVASGLTQSEIKMRSSNRPTKGVYSLTVGVGAKDFKGDAFYAGFVMWGHFAGRRGLPNRTFIKGDDFLRHSGAEVGQQAADATTAALVDGIEKAAQQGGH